MLAGLLSAGQAVILLVVVSNILGLEDAGILTIAFAIGHLLMAVGKYSVRTYQVTDINSVANFNCYFSNRLLTVGVMLFLGIGYILFSLFFRGYSITKGLVVFFVCIMYCIESFEDVFLGLYQKNGFLDVAGKIYFFRLSLTLLIISLIVIIGHNLLVAIFIGTLFTLFLSIFFVFVTFDSSPIKLTMDKYTKKILYDCFPLFLVGFLSFYVTNSPKYAIDGNMSEEIQACFGFISMPVFFIELLSSFIYQPKLVQMSQDWENGQIHIFKKTIFNQIIITIGICIVCIVGAYFWGLPILSTIFHADLSGYLLPFIVLLVGGGELAVVMYMCVVLTILRLQKLTMYIYGLIAIITVMFSTIIVNKYGINGIALFYTFIMGLLGSCLITICLKHIKENVSIK